MPILAEYDGMTWCLSEYWDKQKDCDYAEESQYRDTCIYIRETGSCRHPEVCATMAAGKGMKSESDLTYSMFLKGAGFQYRM